MRPVLEGCCLYESLMDGTLNLGDLCHINDALDVRLENQRRLMKKR